MASLVTPRVRGRMLWFNSEKDLGALRTDGDERLEFPGSAFAPGEMPAGRCAGKLIEFDEADSDVAGIAFVDELNPRRARRRRRG